MNLHPVVVDYLLDLMNRGDMDELERFIGPTANPRIFAERASEWLRKRFAGLSVLELTPDDCVRQAQKARSN